MRKVNLVAALCLAAVPALAADGKQILRPPTNSVQMERFLNGADSPLLFVGKVTWVQRGNLPCTIMNSRSTEWSVSRVLYGFDPGKKISVSFGSCGAVEPQYTSTNEMVVIARPGANGVWDGMRESVVPANDANVRAARKAMDSFLRGEIRRLIRPPRSQHDRSIFVFEGTIVETGGVPYPCPSTVAPIFPVKFEIAQILRGSWDAKEVTVQFLGCGPPPNSQYRVGNRVLVFALPLNNEPKPPLRAGFMLPPAQEDEALADLAAVEGKTR